MDALTNTERERIRMAVCELTTADKSLTNKLLAGIVGCSPGVISQIKSRTYPGDSDRYLAALARWLVERQDRREAPRADFVETSIGRRILAVCGRAWRMPCIGQVVTPSGAGKTMALREFVRRRGGRAVYVQAGEACRTRYSLLREIAERMGLPAAAQFDELYRTLREKLAGYYAGGTADPFALVIDEATCLAPEALNLLRGLHDDERCRVALVLADTWRMEEEFRRRSGRLMGGYEQLTSRCGAVYRLPASRLMDKRFTAYETDVRVVADAVLAQLGARRAISRQSYDYLLGVARGPGALRSVEQRLHAVRDLAEDLDVRATYTVAQLDFVAVMVGGQCELTHKAHPFGAGELEAVASTGRLDRDGESIEPAAKQKDLGDFQANPVILAAHQHRLASGSSSVIGSVVAIEAGKDGLGFRMKFADTELGREYEQLYREKHMRAQSRREHRGGKEQKQKDRNF